TNRRFANELAAFKNGENVDHKNLETIVVPERSKSSFVKLSLILIILSALGYYFIKKPIRNKQIQSAVLKSEMNAVTLEVYEQELAKIDGAFTENREF